MLIASAIYLALRLLTSLVARFGVGTITLSVVDRTREFTVGRSDNMIVSPSSILGRSYTPVSFCRSCAILSRESWQVVLSSSRFPQPVSNTTT